MFLYNSCLIMAYGKHEQRFFLECLEDSTKMAGHGGSVLYDRAKMSFDDGFQWVHGQV